MHVTVGEYYLFLIVIKQLVSVFVYFLYKQIDTTSHTLCIFFSVYLSDNLLCENVFTTASKCLWERQELKMRRTTCFIMKLSFYCLRHVSFSVTYFPKTCKMQLSLGEYYIEKVARARYIPKHCSEDVTIFYNYYKNRFYQCRRYEACTLTRK